MKRLLSINNYHYRRGGADIVYLEHANMFERMGWDSAYFAMQHPKNISSEWSRYFVEEIELGSGYGPLQTITKGVKAIYSFEAQRKLKQLLDDFRPTIAQLHNIYHHLSPAILPVLSSAGIPIVLTAHDLKIACPSYRMLSHDKVCERCKGGNYLHAIAQRCVHDSLAASTLVATESLVHSKILSSYRRYVDKIVVPSEFFIEKFSEWGWERSRFIHIPNFADIDAFQPQFEPGDYFLYFGRLSPEKGLTTLLSASVQASVPVKIAGTGPQLAQLRAAADASGAKVDFVGYRTGSELYQLIRSARAVVLPSEWYENAPLSVLESFALGKPVIGARIGGIPEMVRPDVSGWLYTSGASEDLAELMRKVTDLSSSTIEALGRSAREYAERNFSRSAYQQAFVNLYAGLMQSR